MTIQIDSREKSKAIQKILAEFDRNGIKHFTSKLFVGDYMNMDYPRLVIDRKQNLNELCGNVVQDHKRFAAELERAKDMGISLIVICEHGKNIKTLEDVMTWKNPRLKHSPLAVSGERLYKILYAMQSNREKYDVTFLFCSKDETGRRIIELLQHERTD